MFLCQYKHYMKRGERAVIKLFAGNGIMASSKLVKAAVDQFFGLLWICPGLWISHLFAMQQELHGLAWAKIPICYV